MNRHHLEDVDSLRGSRNGRWLEQRENARELAAALGVHPDDCTWDQLIELARYQTNRLADLGQT